MNNVRFGKFNSLSSSGMYNYILIFYIDSTDDKK